MLNRFLSFHRNATTDFTVKLVLSIALLCTLGPLVLDMKGSLPITLQSLVVLFCAIAFGWRIGLAAILTYLAVGALGLHVFAGYKGGYESFMSPSGGFFFGFVAATLICGFLSELDAFQKTIPAIMLWFIGHAIILLLGFFWLARLDPGWKEKLMAVLPGAAIKSIVGALFIQLIKKFMTRKPREKAFRD